MKKGDVCLATLALVTETMNGEHDRRVVLEVLERGGTFDESGRNQIIDVLSADEPTAREALIDLVIFARGAAEDSMDATAYGEAVYALAVACVRLCDCIADGFLHPKADGGRQDAISALACAADWAHRGQSLLMQRAPEEVWADVARGVARDVTGCLADGRDWP